MLKARSLLTDNTADARRQAVEILTGITEQQPEYVEAWLVLGRVMLNQNNPAEAIDAAIQGLVQSPEDTRLLMLKARAEAATSPALAVPTLNMLRELEPNNVEVIAFLADSYLETGKGERAVQMLKDQIASETDPRRLKQLKTALAVAHHKTDNPAAAEDIFADLQAADPSDPAPLLAQVNLLRADENWDAIEKKVADWLAEHPSDTNPPVTVAASLVQTNSHQARKLAEELLNRILQQDSDNPRALKHMAVLMQTTDRSPRAAEYYRKLLDIAPDDVIAMNNLAWILCTERNEHQKALELANRGLELAPDYIDLIDTRGTIYHKLGKYELAIKDFNRCLDLYPENFPAAASTYLQLARAQAASGRSEQAISSLEKALELNSENDGLTPDQQAEAQSLLEKLTEDEYVSATTNN
jgi:tetratricopeptide (TPR) repeat protein